MNADERRAAQWDCAEVAVRFYRALDARDYSGLVQVMTPDGVWLRQGNRLAGRHAIEEALAGRDAGVSTVHLVSNIIVDVKDSQSATATYYISVHHHHAAPEDTQPPAVPHLRTVQLCTDQLVRDGGAWRISDKAPVALFRTA